MKTRSRRYYRRRDAWKWAKEQMKLLGFPRRQLYKFVDERMRQTRHYEKRNKVGTQGQKAE
jgi:hypothetical protein